MPSNRTDPPSDVNALYKGLANAMNTELSGGGRIGDCKWGMYLFYDYDGEPIYAGQTFESLRSRIGRHLTNQRTDAVAMSVLDPFEVAEVEVWPFWRWEGITKGHRLFNHTKHKLNQAEYTVYRQALAGSKFRAILNEKPPNATAMIGLPRSHRLPILDESIRRAREHPDIRLARRARTIANLARVISERRVEPGIRRTLWAQAQRLEALARHRLETLTGEPPSAVGTDVAHAPDSPPSG